MTVALGKEFDKAELDQLISTTQYESETYRRMLQKTARSAQEGRGLTIFRSRNFMTLATDAAMALARWPVLFPA